MNVIDNDKCTGCQTCGQICPAGCIHMMADCNGFLYPKIDEISCTNCGLCSRSCPGSLNSADEGHQSKIYAAILRDKQQLLKSTSGGVFTAIATDVLENGGVVFGCEYNTELQVMHTCIHSVKELDRLRGSKYVQSDTRNTFSEAKWLLDKGVPVLYSGTPCQIAGLKAFLGREYEHLITVDVVCHGVPSPDFFKKYISWREQQLNGKIINFNFRNKEKKGWGCFIKIAYKKGGRTINKYTSYLFDPYFSLFLKGISIRKCCYECRYASAKRTGDFTLGDFWGVERYFPELPTWDGVSFLMANSEKAVSTLARFSNKLSLYESTLEQVSAGNIQLIHPTEINEMREEFMKAANSSGFQAVYSLWKHTYKNEIRQSRLKSLLPYKVKTQLKNFYYTHKYRNQ